MKEFNTIVDFKYFDTAIREARIPIDENSEFVLSIVEVLPEEPVEGEVVVTPTKPVYHIVLKYVNTLTSEEVPFEMNKSGASQFMSLFSRMSKLI